MAFVFVGLISIFWHRSAIMLGLMICGLVGDVAGFYLALRRRRR
jgi:hypothetical protein